MRTRRNEIVARTLGGRLGQHRGFDIDETGVIEIMAHRLGDLVALTQTLTHHVATQVEIAILQAHLFRDVLIELERKRFRPIQKIDVTREHLDLARGQVRIGRAFRARAHETRDADDEFVAQFLGLGEDLRRIRIADDLHETLAITQIDEDHAAMIATTVDPTRHGDSATDEGFVDLTAIMSAHKGRGCYGDAARGATREIPTSTAAQVPKPIELGHLGGKALALLALDRQKNG